jgi:hypothetical protein
MFVLQSQSIHRLAAVPLSSQSPSTVAFKIEAVGNSRSEARNGAMSSSSSSSASPRIIAACSGEK